MTVLVAWEYDLAFLKSSLLWALQALLLRKYMVAILNTFVSGRRNMAGIMVAFRKEYCSKFILFLCFDLE